MSAATREGPAPRELLELARRVACEAGELVMAMRAGGMDVAATKTSATDVVTAADRASEVLVRDRLLAARPDDGLLGEEGSDSAGTSGVRWVVDPIDGTVNFLYGIPVFAVCIAAEVDGEVVAGVVLNPADGDEYLAVRGQGATRNGQPLSVREVRPLGQMLLATGFSYEPAVRERQAVAMAHVLPRVRDLRRMGSCALDLCMLASGRVDAYVEEGVNPWDHYAAGLVAAEAGARLELMAGASGMTLLVAAPAGAFEDVAALVRESGLAAPTEA